MYTIMVYDGMLQVKVAELNSNSKFGIAAAAEVKG